jgi:probable HAF family extracellular repeat protein
VPLASPVPLVIRRDGRETATVQCPGTVNDTTAEGINNLGVIVGHCGHDASAPAPGLVAFVALPGPARIPGSGFLQKLAVPGAISTWGLGLNDYGDVVGFYANQPPSGQNLPPTWLHAFIYDSETDRFIQVDHPLALAAGGWTRLVGINDAGQAIGFYNDSTSAAEHPFLYENGTITNLSVPGSFDTWIAGSGLNGHGQILLESNATCGATMCLSIYDHGTYIPVTLDLPLNAPRPDGRSGGHAFLRSYESLNDAGQWVGSYQQVLEWGLDIFGGISPTKVVTQNFVARPTSSRGWH